MRRTALATGFLIAFVPSLLIGCDGEKEAEPEIAKQKSLSERKRAPREDALSPEELAEARRKAGFVSHEEQVAEAKAAYEASEKSFVKGHLKEYRKLLADLRKELDAIEASATKWAKAKKPDAAFTAWNEKHKDEVKAFFKSYDTLTEKGSRGGDVQVDLDRAVREWEALVNALEAKVAESEHFGPALAAIREQIKGLEQALSDIEKDETVTAEEPSKDDGDGADETKGDDG